jgi:NIMA (never in mitosis gene a)-related kinase
VIGKGDGEVYVLKRIALPDAGDEAKLHAFQEVDVLQGLHHPHIIRVQEHFWDEEEQDLCVIMAYCEGGDLHGLINTAREKSELVEEPAVWDYLVQLLSALAYLHHDLYIMHRDLKVLIMMNPNHA